MRLKQALTLAMAAALSFSTLAPAMAQDRHDNRRDDHRGGRDNHRPGPRNDHWEFRGDRHWGGGPPRHVVIRPRPAYPYYRPYAVPRTRWFHDVYVYRPYGVAYPGFGFYYRDNDAARFLGLTALSFVALNALTESQQRAHEEAMIQATNAPIGDAIEWDEGGRRGSVVAVRDGQTPDGRQCREFQQNVTISGRDEEAYGTACMQPDGSWQVVNQTN
jgi:hypothetical protein